LRFRARTTATLTLALLAALLAAPLPIATLPIAPLATAVAADGDELAEIERLADEGEKWFREAGDTDAPNSERKAARKEAYVRLKKARKLLDDLIDADESRAEELDSLYSRITMMLFWVKKEAAIGELEGGGPVIPPAPPKETGGGKPSASGIGGATHPGSGAGSKPPKNTGG